MSIGVDLPSPAWKGGGFGQFVASGPLVGFMDADNSTKVSELVRLSRRIGDHDGVIGSRHLPGQVLQRKQPLFRRIQSRIFNGLIRLLFGLPFYDTQCGAKIFKKEALDAVLHIFAQLDLNLMWNYSACQEGYSQLKSRSSGMILLIPGFGYQIHSQCW